MAASTLLALPIVIMFAIIQRKVATGLTARCCRAGDRRSAARRRLPHPGGPVRRGHQSPGRHHPLGLAAAGDDTVREIAVRHGDRLPVGDIEAAETVLVLTRDRHRHAWMTGVVDDIRERRPSAVLIEMGNAGIDPTMAPAIASHGATMANAAAVLAALRPSDPSQS